jgi:N-glycosidase YbiA
MNTNYPALDKKSQEPEYKVNPHLKISSVGAKLTKNSNSMPYGTALLTDTGSPASGLKNQGIDYIIHATPMPEGDSKETFIEIAAKAIQNSIILAERNGIKLLATCLLGGKIYLKDQNDEDTKKLLAEGIIRAALNQMLENPLDLDLIYFVDFDGDYYQEAFDEIKLETAYNLISNKARVVRGNICDEAVHPCEAIVNSENPGMDWGGGVSGAIQIALGTEEGNVNRQRKDLMKRFNSLITEEEDNIKFYHKDKDYYEFTNFAEGYSINFPLINGYENLAGSWETSEQLFQAAGFRDQKNLVEEFRSTGARGAWSLKRDLLNNRKIPLTDGNNGWHGTGSGDWKHDGTKAKKLEIMRLIVEQKFRQHDCLKNLLLGTGNKQIIEDTQSDDKRKNGSFKPESERDNCWGNARNGKNWLGVILMEVRTKLQEEKQKETPPEPSPTPEEDKNDKDKKSASEWQAELKEVDDKMEQVFNEDKVKEWKEQGEVGRVEKVKQLLESVKGNSQFLGLIKTKQSSDNLEKLVSDKSASQVITIIKRFEFDNLSQLDKEIKIKKMREYYDLGENGILTDSQIDEYCYKVAVGQIDENKQDPNNTINPENSILKYLGISALILIPLGLLLAFFARKRKK